jgi:hypothetical protein
LRPVFLDESGKVVNTCEACAQRNGGRQANADDGEKKEDIIMVFALTSDSSLYNVMTTVTDKPEIKRYKFYFTDAASDKPVSNTVEGEVFVHE